MKKLFYILLFASIYTMHAQTITPYVINSAGGSGTVSSGGNNYDVYYNIGEPCVTTLQNTDNMITQGFLQPFGKSSSVQVTPTSCSDKTDGSIMISLISYDRALTSYSVQYYWSPNSICPSYTCSTVSNLPQATYTVYIITRDSLTGTKIDSIPIPNITVGGSSEPCQIGIYNGVTPNGDGNNDYFHIENIESFLNNKVQIFNRWGQKLFETTNYNNKTNRWNGTINGDKETAVSATYFYIIELGNGTKPIKGWLELTSNK